MELTVVIPTKDRPAMLPRAVASVLDQASDVEIIVIDDGSSPESADAIRAFCGADKRVRLLRNASAQGAPHARNQGLAESRGRYWATLDDDNVWLPGKWDAQARVLEGSGFAPDVAVVTAVRLAGEPSPAPRGIPLVGIEPEKFDSLDGLFRRVPPRSFVHSYVAPLELMRSIGGYDDRLVWGEHTDVLIRMSEAARFAGTPVAGVDVEKEHGAERTGRNWQRKVDGVSLILEKHSEQFASAPEERAQYRHVLGVSKLRAGDRWGAVGIFVGIVGEGPGLRRRLRALGQAAVAAIGGRSLWSRFSKDPLEAAG